MDFPNIQMYQGDTTQWAEELVTALERKFRTLETTQNSNFTTGNISILNNTTLEGILEFADNTAAVAGGLGVGSLYRTGDLVKVVHA